MHRLFTYLVFLVLTVAAQEPTPGKVVPQIKCSASPDQSYALYLPSNYDAKRAWPALFMFDPGARGSEAVEAAREAAEAHGVIVIASNNSKNGSGKASLVAGDAMWKDAHLRFKIDPKRTYAAGFSGGARVAILFAKLCPGCVSTVIANGAGFPGQRAPSKDIDFALFLTAGDLDFNYREIIELREQLMKQSMAARAFIFHGPHDWAPKEGWEQAFRWIEVQETRRGVRAKDPQQLKSALDLFTNYAEGLRSEGDQLNALRTYESNVIDFDGLVDASSAVTARDQLRGAKEVAAQLKEENAAFSDERSVSADTTRELRDISSRSPDSKEALSNLRSRLSSLRKKIDSLPDGRQKSLLRRRLGGLLAFCSEYAEPVMQDRHYDIALDLYTAVIDFAKSAPGAHLGKARALASMGKQKDALAETKLALAGGVPADAVRSSPELASLLEKPEWRDLLSNRTN
jgi:dienelactone hydrolase